MQYIDKKLTMPAEVEKWVKNNKPTQWNLSQDYREGYEILREQLRLEQHGLCCYCCQTLQTQATIEHLKCRKNHPSLSYDYNNLLLSCKNPKQCDNAKNNQDLPLTPLMTECDNEIKFFATGELAGETDRAKEAIRILNLNNDKLSNIRKVKYDLIFSIQTQLDLTNDISETTIISDQDLTVEQIDDYLKEAYGETPEYYEYQYLLKKLA